MSILDPIYPNEEDNTGFQQFLEYKFNKLRQDFDEFSDTRPIPYSVDIKNVEGLSNPVFTNDPDISEFPESSQHQLSKLLQDFEQFEDTVLPPYKIDSMYVEKLSDSDFVGAGEYAMGGHGESIQKVNVTTHVQNVNVTTHVGGCGSGGGSSSAGGGGAMLGSFMKSTNPSSNGGSSSPAGSRGGVKVGCFMKYWSCVHSSNGLKIWRQVGVNVMADKPTQRRKRKYRGVYETEAEAAASLERLRIKRREAAAWELEKKQAHEAQLLEQLQSLRAKNEFLKKLLKFLEDNQMIDFPPKPLKRTMSGPI